MRCRLKSESGVTVLYALLIMIVATMVSVVIINAAVTSVKTMHDDLVRERETIAVGSAAKLLAKCIKESYVTVTPQKAEDPEETDTTEYSGYGPMGDFLTKVIQDREEGSLTHTMTVTFDSGDFCSFTFSINPVDGDYSGNADEEYQIRGTVTTEDGTEKVYLTAYISGLAQTSTPTRTDIIYKWDKVSLSTAGGGE